MARAVFSKPLFLSVFLGAIIGGVWWWPGPPPEPIVEGRRLSEYFVYRADRDARPFDEQLKAYGPAGVAWLTYKVEHGSQPFHKEGPLPLDSAPAWLRRWFPEKWGGLRASSPVEERFEAAGLLISLGSEAAPAIPALVRTLDSEDHSLVDIAAQALQEMGPVSWPAVQDVLDHGRAAARLELMNKMMDRLGPGARCATEEETKALTVPALAALVRALRDLNPEVRGAAAIAIGDCRPLRDDDDTRYDSAIPALIALLSDPNPSVSAEAARALSFFTSKAASAIPRLIELLGNENPKARWHAARALAWIDTPGHAELHLRAMLQDQDSNCRQAAREALQHLGIPPFPEVGGGEGVPAR